MYSFIDMQIHVISFTNFSQTRQTGSFLKRFTGLTFSINMINVTYYLREGCY